MSAVIAINSKEVKDKLAKARVAMILDSPFFGSLALRLKLVEETRQPTAWTDGVHLGYNPNFIAGLTHVEIVALVAHEVMHCGMQHIWRRGGREIEKWNVACDYAINGILKDAGFTLPKDGLFPDAQQNGKSAEWIYDRLPDTPKGGWGDGGKLGRICDAPSGNSEGGDEATAQEADWVQAVQQAAAAAKMRGNLPSSLERFAKSAVQARVDWRSALRRFVQSAAKADYSWRRPNTRYCARGLYLPALWSEAMGPIAVAIDTSGSIDNVLLSQFGAELASIVDECKPLRVTVIYADAAVQHVDTFEPGDPIKLNPKGGGGTSFVDSIEHMSSLDEPPVVGIYLTDCYGEFPKDEPAFPFMWACTTRGMTVPFGELVAVE